MNFRYHCLNCKKLIAESNRQLEVNNICSSCSNSWVKKQMDYRNKFGDPAKKSNEDNKRKYARKKLREEENEKNFRQ